MTPYQQFVQRAEQTREQTRGNIRPHRFEDTAECFFQQKQTVRQAQKNEARNKGK